MKDALGQGKRVYNVNATDEWSEYTYMYIKRPTLFTEIPCPKLKIDTQSFSSRFYAITYSVTFACIYISLTAAIAAQKAQCPRIHSPTEESISHLLEETQSAQPQYSAILPPKGE